MKNIEILAQPLERSKHNYALIDRVFYNNMDEDFPVLEVVTPNIQAQAHLYPYLLPLDSLSDSAWVRLNRIINAQTKQQEPLLTSLFFTSEYHPETLSKVLAEQLIKKFDNKYYVLRFYDPRVFVQLLWMLPDNDWLTFSTGTGSSDWSLFIQSCWHSVSLSRKSFDNNEVNITRNLLNIGMINRVLLKLPKEKNIFKYIDLSKGINEALVVSSDKYKLLDVDDRILFAFHSITIGQLFHEVPMVMNVMKKISYQDIGYKELVSDFSELDWKLIKDYTENKLLKGELTNGNSM